MKNNKYSMTHTKTKTVFLLLAFIVLVISLVSTTVAYLSTQTNPIENTFAYDKVTSEVIETFDGTTKSDVKIMNAGNTEAYIRATFIITFQNATGDVHSTQPVLGTDYTIALGTSGWTIGTDGYYYYDPAVPSGSTTANLINSLVSLKAPQGYTLAVDILADAIQATPIEAVREAWPASGR